MASNILADKLRAKASDEGFAICGIASADSAPETAQRLRAWLDEGAHGDMVWMANRAHHRERPKSLWPDVRSLIMLGMSYAPKDHPLRLKDQTDIGRISVYAQGKDYHGVVKKALKRLARWLVAEAEALGKIAEVKVFVDTAPVMEKPLAEAAGIGWQGKHSNLLNRSYGNWLFLGAIYTTLDLPPDLPAADRCGSCAACHVACPTDAFSGPYRLDARRCISYLTIEHKGPIPEEFRAAMGNRIYGCDDCLAVCPWNKFADAAQANKALAARAELAAPKLADLLALDDGSFRRVFADSPIKRIGRNHMIRNCLIAAGNSSDVTLVEPVKALVEDPDAVIRDAAQWALARLSSR